MQYFSGKISAGKAKIAPGLCAFFGDDFFAHCPGALKIKLFNYNAFFEKNTSKCKY